MNIVKSNQITFTRPNDTTQYAAGDLVANNTAAASVTNRLFVFNRCRGPIRIRKWLFQKTDNDTTAASFLLMLFSAAPTYTTGGDNSAITTVLQATAGSYLGTMSVTVSSGDTTMAFGQGVPVVGDYITWNPEWDGTETATLYGVCVANGTYTPTAQGVYVFQLEGEIEGA